MEDMGLLTRGMSPAWKRGLAALELAEDVGGQVAEAGGPSDDSFWRAWLPLRVEVVLGQEVGGRALVGRRRWTGGGRRPRGA